MAFDIPADASAGLSQMERWHSNDPMKFALTGTEEVLAALEQMGDIMPDEVVYQLGIEAEAILSESKREVPWDTTHLLQTGTVEPAESDGRPGYEIGYNAPYAARQHEDLTFHHPKPGRKAKYLEDPFNRHAPQVIPNIVTRMQAFFQQGIPSMTGLRKSTRASMGNLLGRFG